MADTASFSLTPQSALDGYDKTLGNMQLREIADVAIWSVARTETIDPEMSAICGVDLPDIGRSSTNQSEPTLRLLGIQPNQWFVFAEPAELLDARELKSSCAGLAYLTDQSDSWACLRLSGPRANTVLERMCMLNLAQDTFPVGSVTRTLMEHMGVILLRETTDTFVLMAPRSYAGSFLHSVETSISNTA